MRKVLETVTYNMTLVIQSDNGDIEHKHFEEIFQGDISSIIVEYDREDIKLMSVTVTKN